MLKDETNILNIKAKEKIKEDEKKSKELNQKILNIALIKNIININNKLKNYINKFQSNIYDRTTEKFINELPTTLLNEAKKGKDYSDVYIFNYHFLINAFLNDITAKYYLDKRGKEIFEYLELEEFKPVFIAHNVDLASYFSIRIYFNKLSPT